MNKFYNEEFIENIKKRINDGEFDSKESLAQYLITISEMISNDYDFLKLLENSGIEHNIKDLNDISIMILDYYDKTKADLTSLNLDSVTSFKVDDKEYIKVKNPDNTYTVLDNNISKKDFVTQFQDKQNASMDYRIADGIKNRKEILKVMRKEKDEANFESSLDVNHRDLTQQERREFASIMQIQETDTNNFIVDTKRNIYINSDTGETYYAHLNSMGQMEIRKANETKAETSSKVVQAIDEKGIEGSVSVEHPVEQVFEQMDEYELEFILYNKFNSLTDEEKIALKKIIEKKELAIKQQKEQQNQTNLNLKPKVKILTIKNLNNKYNGFTSVLFLCLVTIIYGVFFILYIMISSGSLK